MVTVREYTADDLAAIHPLNEAAVPAVNSVSTDKLGSIADQAVVALVAELDDGTIGGFCLIIPPAADHDSQNFGWFKQRYERFVYLDRVVIAPPAQRQGIGHRFYAEAERLLAERAPDAELLALEVNLIPRNDKSLNFHDQLGFTQVGVRTPSPDYSVSMLTKPLA